MDNLELKVPPPVVALCCAFFMWLASLVLAPVSVPFAVRVALALAFAVIGQGISLAGMRTFRRAGTTINPFKPRSSSSLVSAGVYAFTRNPMYAGLLVTLLGWAVFLSSLLSLIFLPLFVLYVGRFQIAPEERALAALFGSDYSSYCARVRRWV